jgi:flagellar biosynthesis protein FlhG
LKKLSEVIVEGPFGLQVIPGGSGLSDLADLPVQQRENLLRSLLVLDGAIDMLLIDTSAGVDRRVVQFARAAGEVIIVTTCEPTAITDAYALIKVLNNYGTPVTIKLVINMVRRQNEGEMAGRKLVNVTQQFLGKQLEVIGLLPYDEMVPRSVRAQRPLLIEYSRSPAAGAIQQVSRHLWAGERVKGQPKLQSGSGIG